MKRILITLLALVPFCAYAQTTYDEGTSFGARATVEADVKVANGLHILAHEEARYYSNGEDIMRLYTGIGLEYKVLPFLKVGAEYELIKNKRSYTRIISQEPERLEEILEKTATGTLAHLRRMNSDPEYRERLAKRVY